MSDMITCYTDKHIFRIRKINIITEYEILNIIFLVILFIITLILLCISVIVGFIMCYDHSESSAVRIDTEDT